MTTTNKEAYLNLREVPRNPNIEDLQYFFGVPPNTMEQLEANMKKKRRRWLKLSEAPSPEGREQAEKILSLIQEISLMLKNNEAGTIDVTSMPTTPAIDDINLLLENLWTYIFNLLNGGRVDDAIATASQSREKWPDSPIPHAAYAYAVSAAQQASSIVNTSLLERGLSASSQAIDLNPEEEVAWKTRVEILNILGRYEDAFNAANESEDALHGMPVPIRAERALTLIQLGREDDAMVDCIISINAEPDNYALRGQLADSLIVHLAEPILPITSGVDHKKYVEVVQVAAWCADGVPEAEAMVRPHRMWAAQSHQRVFSGSLTTRSFFAVMTGFLSLPLHSWISSDEAWQLFVDGPNDNHMNWEILADARYLKTIHENVQHKLNWVGTDGSWPATITQISQQASQED